MKNLITTTKVEWLKTKGLGLTYLALILGVLLPLLALIYIFFSNEAVLGDNLPSSIFEESLANNL